MKNNSRIPRSKRRKALQMGIIRLKKGKLTKLSLFKTGRSLPDSSFPEYDWNFIKVRPNKKALTVKNYIIPFVKDLSQEQRLALGL